MSVELWTPPPPTAVTVARHAFRTETVTLEMPHGATIDEIIVAAGLPAGVPVRVWLGDWEIAPAYWGSTRPRPGTRVLIRAVAGGGGGGDSNKTLRMVLMIVVLVVAIAISVFVPLLWPAVPYIGAIAFGASAAVSIGGGLAINALLPPPKPKLRENTLTQATPTYALTGTQNQLAPYQAVPRVYGRHRLYPPLAAHPVTAGQGTTQTLSQLFTLGYGPLQIENIQIGDTPIGLYEGVTLEVRVGVPGEPPLDTFPYDTFEEPLGIDLTPPEGRTSKTVTRATAPADVIGIEVLFPRGLFRVEADNTSQPFSGVLTVIGVPASTGVAVLLLQQSIAEQRVESLRFSYAFEVREWGETPWTLHVNWAIPAGWEGPERPNPVVIYDLVWSALRLTRYEDPIPLPGMAKIGVTLTASGQLTGVVNQLNCIATAILPTWYAGAGWVEQPTRNPAWAFLNALLGSATSRPIPPALIDDQAIFAWAVDCDAQGYTFDAVFDTQTTVFEALSLIAAAGRASFSMRDGKYSLVRDVPQTVPVQQFTPRNSTGFSATKLFTDIPHALKVRFINPAANWQQDEVLVCDDGYSATPVGDGVEVVTNGQFTTDLSGWTVTNTGAGQTVQAAGAARMTGDALGQAFLSQAVPTVAGTQYRLSFTVNHSAVAFRAGSLEGAEDLLPDQVLLPGDFTATFYALATECWPRFFKGDYQATGIDNVSVRVVTDGADPGVELVVNGQFTTDLSGWTVTTTGAGTITQVAGEAGLTGAGHGQTELLQAVPTVAGVTYILSFTVADAGVDFWAGSSEGTQDLVRARVVRPGPFTTRFQALSAVCWLHFFKGDTAAVGIDTVSVQAIGIPMPTKFEGLEVFGVTDAALAWRHGRYWIAAARLRPETYTLGVDIEHLVAQRGDLVHVQHDVPLWGYGSGRITSVTRDGGGLVILFSLDELFADVPWATQAAARVRFESGESGVYNVSMYPRPELRVTDFSLHTPQALPLNLGDLVSIGEMGQETVPCLITRIEAGPDLSARLTLVDLAPGIHSADTGPIPPFESFVTRVPVLNRLPPLPPIIDGWGSDELHMLEISPGNWVISIRVGAHAQVVPDRLVPTLLELQFRPVGSAAQWTQLPPQTVTAGGMTMFYAVPVTAGITYDVRVRAVAGPESVASTWATFTHVVVGETTPPPPPINLSLDLDGTHLRWQYPTPPRDFPGGFQVRYVLGVTDRWEDAFPLHGGLVSDTRFALPPLGAGTYTFLVKAVDRGGHLSREPAVLVSDYAGYVPVNILHVIDLDAAGFPGDQDSLVYETSPPPPSLCNALLTDGPFWTLDSARFWSADAALFWGDVYAAGYYQIGIVVPVEDAGTTLTLDWTGTGPWVVEYRTAGDSAFWARHTPYFWETADTVFWSDGLGAWRPWPGALVVHAQGYGIRWSTPGPQEACLTRAHLVFDVDDIIEWIDDFALPAVPTRLPLSDVYRTITHVQLTVVQSVGAPVRVVDVLDKSTLGPLVRARLVDGTAVAAQIDAVIKGY